MEENENPIECWLDNHNLAHFLHISHERHEKYVAKRNLWHACLGLSNITHMRLNDIIARAIPHSKDGARCRVGQSVRSWKCDISTLETFFNIFREVRWCLSPKSYLYSTCILDAALIENKWWNKSQMALSLQGKACVDHGSHWFVTQELQSVQLT